MRKLNLLAGVLFFTHVCAEGQDSMADRAMVVDRMAVTTLAEVAALPNTCGQAPLPLTPQGPVVTAQLRYSTRAPVNVKAWRFPCSASESMVVMTLEPVDTASPTFICQPRFQLLQAGGMQTTAFDVKNDPSTISSYCAEVVAPVTVALVPRSNTPASFDFNQGMTIDYDGLGSHQTIAIQAYNPALYSLTPPPGPDAVRVTVSGTGTSFRNCTVTNSPVGGGKQYTATCGSEAPLKAGGFETYDY